MNRDELLALADRVEQAGTDLVCPLCADDSYDVAGLAHHMTNGCVVVDFAIWKDSNSEVAADLRAKAGAL